MKISILLFTLILSVATSFAQKEVKKSNSELKAELKRAKAEAIREIVKSKNFVFKAETVNPMNTRTKTLTSDFGIEVRNDTVFSYMPYYGNTYSRDYTTFKDSPMGFIQPVDTFTTKRTKKGYLVKIRVTNVHDVIDLNFHINLDGLATASASSINRQAISYTGVIIIPSPEEDSESENDKW
ncbi:MAG TPA: hypothetical protein DER09_15145 [Prolixibacteraceae bacterium]|nr:hypothetical protein [Prolixibacteraceae bacterium]